MWVVLFLSNYNPYIDETDVIGPFDSKDEALEWLGANREEWGTARTGMVAWMDTP